jgi:hypothetical protein
MTKLIFTLVANDMSIACQVATICMAQLKTEVGKYRSAVHSAAHGPMQHLSIPQSFRSQQER